MYSHRRVKIRSLVRIVVLFVGFWIQGCQEPWNDPYPEFKKEENTLYTAFTERPKHLDPALSYEATEAIFTYQIYEPPLQYHYLKRPYELVPLIAETMPMVSYFDENHKPLGEEADAIAYSVYRIKIKEGVFFQPHPAFAKESTTQQYRYHNLKAAEIKDKHTLQDFPYQDTRELTAEDFIYEIKRLADPTVNSPIYGVMENFIIGFKEFSEKVKPLYQNKTEVEFVDLNAISMKGLKKLDNYTYEITIQGKSPQFLNWLAMPFFAPMPWEAIKFYSQEKLLKKNISLDWYPVGTGPFLLAMNNPNLQMILAKNPNFHGETYPTAGEPGDREKGLLQNAGKPLPFLDKIVFVLEKENIPYWNKFLQGYYDQSGVTSNNFDQALTSVGGGGNLALSDKLKEKNIRLSTSVLPSIFYWGFNMLDETVGGTKTQNKKLRQALSIALDIEEYINIFLNGSGIPAQSVLAPGIFGQKEGLDGVNPIVYDIDKSKGLFERKAIDDAKKLLAQAGYPNGINPKTQKPLTLYLDSVGAAGPDSAAQMTWIRKQFNKLGIELIVRGTQYNRFQDKIRTGDFQIFSWGWAADYPDPENFFFLLYSKNGKVKFGGENATNYNNPEFDKLFEKMKNMKNSPKRQKIIDKMIMLLREDAPWIGGYHPKLYALRQSWVGPTKPNEMSRNTLKYLSINPEIRAKYQTLWNQPMVWPLGIALIVLLLLCLPAGIFYWHKMFKEAPLQKPKPLN